MHTLQQLRSGELTGAKSIKLSCALEEFPSELFELAESLEILDLSHNRLKTLPKDFYRFSKLKIIFCSDNLFTELPAVLGQCASLEMIGFKSNQIKLVSEESLPSQTRWLILTNNKIGKLPASIGKCYRLQKCALAGNLLKSLPDEMSACKNLELLRISANKLEGLPQWLLTLPKLAWLAFSGNIFNKDHQELRALKEIQWNELQILELLGEGASGHIYKAVWNSALNKKEVAVKIFKGEVTSDGFPEDEMQAFIAAEKHDNLVSLLGSISQHPEQKTGLVMELIPASYKNLGLPPSFSTCTRDTFPAGEIFSIEQIHKIVLQIALVADHLHSRGILHGDLYAHNILIGPDDHCLKGDFGAASFYDVKANYAKNLESIELRALGCLIDDLLSCHDPGDNNSELKKNLEKLRDDLMQEEILKRPSFAKTICLLKEF